MLKLRGKSYVKCRTFPSFFFFGNFMKWRRKTIIQTKTNPLKQMGFNSNCYGFTVWYLFPSCNAWYERPNVLCSLWIYGCLVRSQFTVHRLKLCVCWAWLRQCIATIFSKAGEKNTTFTIKRVKNMCSIARFVRSWYQNWGAITTTKNKHNSQNCEPNTYIDAHIQS